MNLSELFEARRNPDANTGNKRRDGIEDLLKWSRSHEGEYFVSFTSVPKIGINPQSEYDTPIGIYTYPLSDTSTVEEIEDDMLPFAGREPHINVLRLVSDKVVRLQDGAERFKELNQGVTEWLADRLEIVDANEHPVPRETAEAVIWDKVYGYAVSNTYKSSSQAGGYWWNYARLAAMLVKNEGKETFSLHDIGVAASHVDYNGESAPALWTNLMLSLGVEGAIDIGGGVIHGNEPTQAVFFTTRAFKLVDRLFNPRQTLAQVDIQTTKQFARFLQSCKDNIPTFPISQMLSCAVDGESFKQTMNIKNRYSDSIDPTMVVFYANEPASGFFAIVAKIYAQASSAERARMLQIGGSEIEIALRKNKHQTIVLWIKMLLSIVGKEVLLKKLSNIYAPWTSTGPGDGDEESLAAFEKFKAQYGLA